FPRDWSSAVCSSDLGLRGVDPQQALAGPDLLGERELDEDAVDLRVGVQAIHHADQLLVRGVARQYDAARVEAGGLGGPALHPDVYLARRVVSHEDGGEPGLHAGLLLEARGILGDLRAHRLAEFGPAQDPSHSLPQSAGSRVSTREVDRAGLPDHDDLDLPRVLELLLKPPR